MCEKAQEIQKLRESHRNWENQDFCLEISENNCYDIEACNGENFGLLHKSTKQNGIIWLPRQDQLQSLLNRSIWHLQQSFHHWFLEIAKVKNNDTRSMEQFWLEFVMRELYWKFWDEQKQNWVVDESLKNNELPW